MTILTEARQKGATDIHIAPEKHLFWRINGRLEIGPLIGAAEFAALEESLKETYFQGRITSYRAEGTTYLAIRLFPEKVPAFRHLGLPASFLKLVDKTEGLILFTGPTGSGKTTSMASFLEALMQKRSLHVMTFENPIEYILDAGKSLLQQCEHERDYNTLQTALYDTLRRDVDVIMIGELRQPEEIRTALLAAETGHLVIAGMHARNMEQVISSMLLRFSEREAQALKESFIYSLQALVHQRLLPTKNGKQTLVADVLMGTPAIRQSMIKQLSLQAVMESEVQQGHVLMAASIRDKVKQGIFDELEVQRLLDEEINYYNLSL